MSKQWCQQSLDCLGVTHAHIFSGKHATSKHITHQIDRFVAFVGLNAVNRDDQATICPNLLVPRCIVGGLMGGTNQGRIGIEEIGDFATRDGLLKRGETGLKHLMSLVKGVVLGKTEMTDQNDDVESEGKARQGQGVGGSTAVGALGGGTGRVGAAVAAVREADGTSQRDDRTLRKGGIAAQARATTEAGGEFRATDPFGGVRVDFRAAHRVTSSREDSDNCIAQCSTCGRTPLLLKRTFPLP